MSLILIKKLQICISESVESKDCLNNNNKASQDLIASSQTELMYRVTTPERFCQASIDLEEVCRAMKM
jgi:hypothetical protein